MQRRKTKKISENNNISGDFEMSYQSHLVAFMLDWRRHVAPVSICKFSFLAQVLLAKSMTWVMPTWLSFVQNFSAIAFRIKSIIPTSIIIMTGWLGWDQKTSLVLQKTGYCCAKNFHSISKTGLFYFWVQRGHGKPQVGVFKKPRPFSALQSYLGPVKLTRVVWKQSSIICMNISIIQSIYKYGFYQ